MEKEPASISFDNGHLYLKGKIIKVAVDSETGIIAPLQKYFNVICTSEESTAIICCIVVVPDAAIRASKGVIDDWCATCGPGI